jgi:hypothetical protein
MESAKVFDLPKNFRGTDTQLLSSVLFGNRDAPLWRAHAAPPFLLGAWGSLRSDFFGMVISMPV